MDQDELERLIDERARAIVEKEKAERLLLAQEAAEKERAELDEEERRFVVLQQKNASQPRTLAGSWLLSARAGIVTAFFFCIFPGLLLHMFLFGAIGRSPAALACPYVCEGCTAHARVFSWNYEGNWHRQNGQMGYAFICANPVVDIDKLTEWDVVSDDALNARLQPFMMSSVSSWGIEFVLLFPLGVLAAPLGTRRLRRTLEEEESIKRKLESIAERRRKLLEKLDSDAPYR
jgi:hypothetical protein